MLVAAFLVAAVTDSASAQSEAPDARTQAETTAVRKALDRAIQAIEKKDFKTLSEKFIPIAVLQLMREAPGGFDAQLKEMQAAFGKNPGQLEELLMKLRRAKKFEPAFNTGGTKASIEITIKLGSTLKAADNPLIAAGKADANVTGYSGTPTSVAKQAVADLEAGKLEACLTRMLPISELKLGHPARLAARLKTSSSLKQMIHDLKQMQATKPDIHQNDTVAIWKLPMDGPAYKRADLLRPRKPRWRIVKLQKSGGHWRFFDNVSAMANGTITQTLLLEKVGANWRLANPVASSP